MAQRDGGPERDRPNGSAPPQARAPHASPEGRQDLTLFVEALDVMNRALETRRGRSGGFPLAEALDRKRRAVVAVLDPESGADDHYVLRMREGSLEIVGRCDPERSPRLEIDWAVQRPDLLDVVRNPGRWAADPTALARLWHRVR